jgi:hypothetical protein
MLPTVGSKVIIRNKVYKVEELYKESMLVSFGEKFICFYYNEIESYAI